ncbi:helix-turn-helix domain-containing protein [Candidatus Pacearchaeota archaeon]|nr:helix-turn-helix domain-containing protein [Candidatus Pacearchaeota archaeon]
MVQCAVCGKSGADTLLFEGIYQGSVRPICRFCSVNEKIMLIKKPTEEQLRESEKRQSVRQLMDKLSSPQSKIMSKDSMIAHKNLAKLNFPAMKQEHLDLVQNYDWVLKQARRHRKLSTAQVAQLAGIDKKQLESLEAGQVYEGFEKVVEKVEKVLDVKIIKHYESTARMIRTPEQRKDVEKEVLANVTNKIEGQKKRGIFSFFKKQEDDTQIPQEEIEHEVIDVEGLKQQKKEQHERLDKIQKDIESDEFDFSDRAKLDKIKLQDLADMKKRREATKK